MKKIISIILSVVLVMSILPLGVISSFAADEGLLLHYDMAEQGTTVKDTVGTNDGTLVGNTSWTAGLSGNAVALGGATDYINIPNAAFITDETVSISMWIRPEAVSNWTALFVAGDSGSNYAVFALKGTPGGNSVGITMAIKYNNGAEYRVAANSGVEPAVGEWSHVIYTQTDTTATIFLNGQQVAQSTGMLANIKDVLENAANTDVRIGNNRMFNDPSFKGDVCDIKVYNRALSADEVKADYDRQSATTALLELEAAVSAVDLGDLINVNNDLDLTTSVGNIKVAWTSSDEKFVTADGKVTLPTEEEGDQEITLTATFTSNKTEETRTKEFKFTLTPMNDSKIAKSGADFVQRYVDYIINDGYELLTGEAIDEILGETLGCTVEWKLTDGEAQIKDGKIYKTENSAERQPIKLEAIVTKNDESVTVRLNNVTLLDEYAGYILSFFGGEDGQQKLHLGYSYDGINWVKLNDGYTVLPTTVGNGTVRDPYIMRKKDGSFAVIATQGWDTPQIYLWDSEDLVKYENERLKTVTRSGVAGLTGARAWAPEASYDPINDEYIVYWSDPQANGGSGNIYANTSADLETFSDPFVFFDAGYQIIDANILKWQGSYYMMFKDERGNNSDGGGGKNILMAKSDSLTAGSFKQFTDPVTDSPVEGPFMFKLNGEEKWYHYYDYFNEHKFGVSVTDDLSSGEWEFLGKSTTMPTDDVRHGGVVAVTQKELDAIIDGYDMTVIDITDPDEITVPLGTAYADLDLPVTVELVRNASTQDVAVIWSGDYDGSTPGTYYLTGALDDSIILAEGVEVKLAVTVDETLGEPTVYEAENANLAPGTAITDNPGSSGGKHVGNVMENSNCVTFMVNADHAGVRTMTISYVTMDNRNLEFSINDGETQVIACPGNGVDWNTTVKSVQTQIELKAGENTIVFGIATGAGPNLDCITVSSISKKAKVAAVADVEAVIQTLLKDVTEDNLADVNAVLAKYSELSAEQKNLLSDDAKKAVASAQSAIDNMSAQQKADEVEAIINELKTITDEDELKAAVVDARAAYEKLSDVAKALVGEDALKTLEKIENSLKDDEPINPPVNPPVDDSKVIKGDLTDDGKVTVSDILALKTIIMSGKTPTAEQLAVADLNATPDGRLTVSDILGIKAIIMG